MKTWKDYLDKGKEIFNKFCGGTAPTMLPRAPQHTYIDIYQDEDEPGPSFKDDKRRQADYEAEVQVYRALEVLKEKIVVLHSFKYTHHQYRMCDKSHVRKGCLACSKTPNIREGECDFLIIAKNYFVIIEVKNMSSYNDTLSAVDNEEEKVELESRHTVSLEGSYKKSITQRNKIRELIRSIEKPVNIQHFTAYPNFTRKSRDEFRLKPDQLSSLILKEDLEDLESWWRGNVSEHFKYDALNSKFLDKNETVTSILLAIWCTDNQSRCETYKCSLGWCIEDIDSKLKYGNFTFRKDNPNVVPAPNIFKEFLGVNNLTKSQSDAYNCQDKRVLINGPAGVGKTIILIAKAIQLAKSDNDRRSFFFVSCNEAGLKVLTILQKAGIRSHKLITDSIGLLQTLPLTQISETIFNKFNDYQVVIINGLHINDIDDGFRMISRVPTLINLHSNCDVFIDDLQNTLLTDDSATIENNMHQYHDRSEIVEDIASIVQINCHIWISYDIAQDGLRGAIFSEDGSLPPLYTPFKTFKSIVLTRNLRNSHDISNTLSVVRKHIAKETLERETQWAWSRLSEDTNIIQLPGHFIKGPKVIIHFFYFRNFDLMERILTNQLAQIHQGDGSREFDLTVLIHSLVRTDGLIPLYLWVQSIVDNFKRENGASGIPVLTLPVSCSAEWPAVIGIHECQQSLSLDIPLLYLIISRARVFCNILLIPGPDFDYDEYDFYPKINNLLNDLDCSAEIVKHY